MKRIQFKYIFLFFGLMLMMQCKEPTKGTLESNPIFESEPVLKELTAAIAEEPTKASLYFDRGRMLVKLKQDTLAMHDFIKAATLDTTKADYFSAVGDILFENKDLNGSVKWLEKAIAKNPSEPRARLKIAKLFLYIAQHDKAIEQINIVLRKDIYNPEAYYLKGMIYKDRKDTAKAISSFMTAVQVVPDYQPAIVQLGLLYSAKNDPIALKYLQNAAKTDTNDVFPIYAQGVYLKNNKDWEGAKSIFKECILKNRRYIDAYFDLGYVYLQQDSLEKSYHEFELVIQMQPYNAFAHYNKGVCNELMHKLPEAVIDYRHAYLLDTGYKSPQIALKRLGVPFTKEKNGSN